MPLLLNWMVEVLTHDALFVRGLQGFNLEEKSQTSYIQASITVEKYESAVSPRGGMWCWCNALATGWGLTGGPIVDTFLSAVPGLKLICAQFPLKIKTLHLLANILRPTTTKSQSVCKSIFLYVYKPQCIYCRGYSVNISVVDKTCKFHTISFWLRFHWCQHFWTAAIWNHHP